MNSGPRLKQRLQFPPPLARSLGTEYQSLRCNIEIVDDVDDAIEHIHKHGSGHTDAIVTENGIINIKEHQSRIIQDYLFHFVIKNHFNNSVGDLCKTQTKITKALMKLNDSSYLGTLLLYCYYP